ncbi:hypothetical protein V6N13_030056 [Hibiscus sabdariffa]
MSEDALGLGFTETSEISAWLRLEWQAFSVNFDEQRVMKKVKIRSVVIEQHGVVSPGVLEQELCGNPEYAGAVINNQSHCYFPLANKQVNKVSHEDLFGPWMVVEDRRRRNHRYENPGKCMTKGATGSRFDVLHDFPWEDVVVNVGITMEGVSEYHGPSVATQSPWGEHRVFKVFRLF